MLQLMGMNYAPGLSHSETTFLIAADDQSQKCQLAQKWGLTVKSKSWIYSCFKEWCIID